MQNETLKYFIEYQEFMNSYAKGAVDGEAIGAIVMRMAYYFAEFNSKLASAGRNLSLIARDFEERKDESTGKAISSTKAKVLTEATQENYDYDSIRAHKENCEQFINALKSLQKGVINEMAHTTN